MEALLLLVFGSASGAVVPMLALFKIAYGFQQ